MPGSRTQRWREEGWGGPWEPTGANEEWQHLVLYLPKFHKEGIYGTLRRKKGTCRWMPGWTQHCTLVVVLITFMEDLELKHTGHMN